jgi:hypothetical protein
MPFHPPTEAEIRSWCAQARHHEQAARRSGRAQVQAELPRGQREVFQLKIVLEDSKPPIWRRVLIPANLRLPDLHGVVQLAMGWHDAHLYHFMVGNRSESVRFYGDPDLLDIDLMQQAEGRFINDLNVPIDHLLVNRKDWIRYEYDFGDGWIHRLTLEDIHVQPFKMARVSQVNGPAHRKTVVACLAMNRPWKYWPIQLTPSTRRCLFGLAISIQSASTWRLSMLSLSSRLLTSRSSWPRSYPRLKVFRRRELGALACAAANHGDAGNERMQPPTKATTN